MDSITRLIRASNSENGSGSVLQVLQDAAARGRAGGGAGAAARQPSGAGSKMWTILIQERGE